MSTRRRFMTGDRLGRQSRMLCGNEIIIGRNVPTRNVRPISKNLRSKASQRRRHHMNRRNCQCVIQPSEMWCIRRHVRISWLRSTTNKWTRKDDCWGQSKVVNLSSYQEGQQSRESRQWHVSRIRSVWRQRRKLIKDMNSVTNQWGCTTDSIILTDNDGSDWLSPTLVDEGTDDDEFK